MKTRNWMLGLTSVLALGLATACSDSDDGADGGIPPGADSGINTGNTCTGAFNAARGVVCDGFIAVNFTIDDSTNKTYTADDFLAWKGSFDYDSTTRILSKDPNWAAPYPLVYDDGPWDDGGHEPLGATAGDSIWGIATFVEVPAAGEDIIGFEYGAIRNSNANGDDGAWIWTGSNGTFDVAPGDSGELDADGLTIQAFGTKDLRLTIDLADVRTASIAGATPYDDVVAGNGVGVKSSAWGWSPIALMDDGMNGDMVADDEIFTFVLSAEVGEGPFKHVGLLASGQRPEWVFFFGPFDAAGEGREYKGGDGNIARAEGVTASTRTGDTGDWTSATVDHADNGNTIIVVP